MPPLPPIGSTIHYRNGPLAHELGHRPCDCLHCLVVRYQSESEIVVALKSPQGWLIFRNVKYAPLADCELTGTWHPDAEHREIEV